MDFVENVSFLLLNENNLQIVDGSFKTNIFLFLRTKFKSVKQTILQWLTAYRTVFINVQNRYDNVYYRETSRILDWKFPFNRNSGNTSSS